MKIVSMNPKELRFRENVRWRADSDLSELMESIKQHGIQSPIKAREEDNTIIYGHRRVAAAIKLQLDRIPVILEKGVSDKEANVLNLLENMQRKDVTSIEIGRQCDLLLKEKQFKMSLSELAVSLGISSTRVKTCLDAFKRLPEKYRKSVVHLTNPKNRKYGDLPENLVFAILNFGRKGGGYMKLSEKQMDLLFKKTSEEKLTINHINLIQLMVNSGMSMSQAIKEVDLYTIARLNFVVLKTELASIQRKENISTKQGLFNKLVRDAYPNLIF